MLLTIVILACGACSPSFPDTQAAPEQSLPAIRTPNTRLTPTVPPLSYTVGAWPSNSAPAAGSSVKIFVSFRDAGAPVAGGHVSVVAHYPGRTISFGPFATGSDGYTALAVPVGGIVMAGPGHTPASVLVDVYVSYQGQTYSTVISFAPLG